MERKTASTSDPERERRVFAETGSPQRASLLVRCWVEETSESGPVIRGWVKNLHTGRERLFGDPGLVETILQEETCCPEA